MPYLLDGNNLIGLFCRTARPSPGSTSMPRTQRASLTGIGIAKFLNTSPLPR